MEAPPKLNATALTHRI